MIQKPFDHLAILQGKIEDALEKSNFKELETLSEHWRSDQSDEKIWFRAVQIMGEVAPLVEEYKQQVWLETGQTFLN